MRILMQDRDRLGRKMYPRNDQRHQVGETRPNAGQDASAGTGSDWQDNWSRTRRRKGRVGQKGCCKVVEPKYGMGWDEMVLIV